jgi:hypothetical protein
MSKNDGGSQQNRVAELPNLSRVVSHALRHEPWLYELCDGIPPLDDEALTGIEYVLAEDDWRQFEMVAQLFAEEADAEIAAIRQIHETASDKIGWREIHVRARPDPPIPATFTLEDVTHAFGGEIVWGGVSYRGAGSRIKSGYSFAMPDGLRCYGVEQEGRITVFGIAQQAPDSPPSRSVDCLTRIAREFNIDLIHWCRCVRVPFTDPLFRQLLTGIAAAP